jgi:hypothetical protein
MARSRSRSGDRSALGPPGLTGTEEPVRRVYGRPRRQDHHSTDRRFQYPLSRCGADARLSCLPGRAGAVPRAAGDQAGGAATRDTLALARVIVAPRSEEHQMSVFIVSRRAGRSRPVATRRCTTKGAGAAGTPGRAGSALPDPPPLCRLPRCRGRVMAWPAAGSGVVAAGGRGGGEDEQAQYQARQSPAPRGA